MNDILKIIVSKLHTELQPLYYRYADWGELLETISAKGGSPLLRGERYPLLFLDSNFSTIEYDENYKEAKNVKIYLICQSNLSYSTETRETQTFEAILYERFERLIKEMNKGANFHKLEVELTPELKALNRLKIGANGQNKLSDNLDALQITFDSLIYKFKNC